MFFITLFIQPFKPKRPWPLEESKQTILRSEFETEERRHSHLSEVAQMRRNTEQQYFLERRPFL
jgi:hypothetical protein